MLTELEKWLLSQAKILHKMGYLVPESEPRTPSDAFTIVSAFDTYGVEIETLKNKSGNDFVPASLRLGKHEPAPFVMPSIEQLVDYVNAGCKEFLGGKQDWYDTRNLILSMKTLVERLQEKE